MRSIHGVLPFVALTLAARTAAAQTPTPAETLKAQTPPPAQAPTPAPTPPPASAPTDPNAVAAGVYQVKQQTKMIIYPAKGQTPEVQAKDEQECYLWAQQQTGINPLGPKPNVDSAAQASQEQMAEAAQGAAVGGAARGAAGGAVVGAITGDAGEGAAVGAVVGAAAGRRARKTAEAQAAQQGAAQAQGVAAEQMATFKKGMSACLTGRGYTVQ